jgi:chorismate mutase
METVKLVELRDSIDDLDREIVALLSQRFKLTEEVGIYKAQNTLDAQDITRESEQFNKIIQLSKSYGINPDYSLEIYRCIIDIVISRHQELQRT